MKNVDKVDIGTLYLSEIEEGTYAEGRGLLCSIYSGIQHRT